MKKILNFWKEGFGSSRKRRTPLCKSNCSWAERQLLLQKVFIKKKILGYKIKHLAIAQLKKNKLLRCFQDAYKENTHLVSAVVDVVAINSEAKHINFYKDFTSLLQNRQVVVS
mgnify:CR=1 FL=1